ncbi:MAG: gamma-glutamyltransferase, partial [Holophagales bacterium]|nr:gamma-glutamyltransferase [Holophagales bacterium]
AEPMARLEPGISPLRAASPAGSLPVVFACLAFAVGTLFPAVAAEAASRPTLRGTGGAVASDEAQATEVGVAILASGGNAVDAAVATALALAVVQPEAGNLGGGGFALVKGMGEGEVTFLDFREEAPAAATRDMYLGPDGAVVPEASLVGPLAAGVPGSPAGLHELHRRHGKMPWAEVVAPARRLADEGFVVSSRLTASLEEEAEVLRRFPETSAVWFPGGEAPEPGSILRLADLAATLEAFAKHGPKAIVEGRVARTVEEVSRRHGGILTAADMAAYEPVWRPPVRFETMGWQVASADLPSSGGILLASSLRQLEMLGWAEQPRFGAHRAHLMAEALRRAYADRFLLGDPRTTNARAADLLAADWLASRAASIDPKRATPSDAVRLYSDLEPADGGAGVESSDTTHLSVVDSEGRLVALTFTLNGLFGCGLYVPGAGFFLNNEMDDFAAAPGKPNLYGLVQGEANAVAAGKRMLSSQTPTIAWRLGSGGEAVEAVALGGRGGSRIPTAGLQVLLGLWIDGDGLQEALDRPRIHHQWRPDVLFYEPDALSPETRADLTGRGHELKERESVGQVQAVRWWLEQGKAAVGAGADPRGGGGAAGVVEPVP